MLTNFRLNETFFQMQFVPKSCSSNSITILFKLDMWNSTEWGIDGVGHPSNVPVFKHVNHITPENHRPIFLASCVFQLLERLVHGRITLHIRPRLDETQGDVDCAGIQHDWHTEIAAGILSAQLLISEKRLTLRGLKSRWSVSKLGRKWRCIFKYLDVILALLRWPDHVSHSPLANLGCLHKAQLDHAVKIS